jgi:hypothetical protein
MVASKAITSWPQALLKIVMITLCAKSPYPVCLSRCFLSVDIFCSWRNSPGAKNNHSWDIRFILVRAPMKQVKALRPIAICLYYDLIK